jgi:tetratricopeptide (TPR) repeat protein
LLRGRYAWESLHETGDLGGAWVAYLTLGLFNNSMKKRRGTPPKDPDSPYDSRVEEEYYRAISCLSKKKSPMKDVVVFFKEITQKQRNDPGAQVAKVLNFKDTLNREESILYKEFSTFDEYVMLLKAHLRDWLANDRADSGKMKHNFKLEFSPYQNKSIDAIEFPGERIDEESYVFQRLEEIKALADNNDVNRAKEEYRALVTETNDIAAKNDYAKYLYRLGKLRDAEELYRDILQVATSDRNLGWISRASANLSIILNSKGLNDEAQRLLDDSLHFNRIIKHEIGIADNYRHLANLKRLKGQIDSALSDAKEALRIFTDKEYKSGLADCNSDLGVIYRIKCELDKAEDCYKAAEQLNIELNRQSCLADNRSVRPRRNFLPICP